MAGGAGGMAVMRGVWAEMVALSSCSATSNANDRHVATLRSRQQLYTRRLLYFFLLIIINSIIFFFILDYWEETNEIGVKMLLVKYFRGIRKFILSVRKHTCMNWDMTNLQDK